MLQMSKIRIIVRHTISRMLLLLLTLIILIVLNLARICHRKIRRGDGVVVVVEIARTNYSKLLLSAATTNINMLMQRGFILFLSQTQSCLLFKILQLISERKNSTKIHFLLDILDLKFSISCSLFDDRWHIQWFIQISQSVFSDIHPNKTKREKQGKCSTGRNTKKNNQE